MKPLAFLECCMIAIIIVAIISAVICAIIVAMIEVGR